VADPIDAMSLGLALMFGLLGLPHILMRFYTVPDARAARTSVLYATGFIGYFYIIVPIVGFGATALVGRELIRKIDAGGNMAAPLLADKLGGTYFMAFVAAVAFATILAVVAGLTISASSAFAHDIWWNIIRKGKGDEKEQMFVARAAAATVGIIAIVLSLGLRTLNVAFLVGLAFAVAASANVPAIVLSLAWRRFNKAGAIGGMVTGLVSSLAIIAISPAIMGIDPPGAIVHHFIQATPIYPLENPGLVSIPLGFLGAIVGTLFKRDAQSEEGYDQLLVRANTGMGAEV